MARQGRKRSDIIEIMASYKRNKTIYNGSRSEDKEEEEEDKDNSDPRLSRSRDKIAAAADIDPFLLDYYKYKRGIK